MNTRFLKIQQKYTEYDQPGRLWVSEATALEDEHTDLLLYRASGSHTGVRVTNWWNLTAKTSPTDTGTSLSKGTVKACIFRQDCKAGWSGFPMKAEKGPLFESQRMPVSVQSTQTVKGIDVAMDLTHSCIFFIHCAPWGLPKIIESGGDISFYPIFLDMKALKLPEFIYGDQYFSRRDFQSGRKL